jgi:translocation and assembly module TamA
VDRFFLLFACVPSGLAADLKVQYSVELKNPEDSQFIDQVRQVSRTVQKQDDPPATIGLLRRRINADLPRMTDVLKAQGHFDARIKARVESEKSGQPVQVVFQVHPGPMYTVHNLRIRSKNQELSEKIRLPDRAEMGLDPQAPAKADAIRNARSAILSALHSQGYVLASAQPPRVHLNSEHKTVDLVYVVSPGPLASFGPLSIQGLEQVDADYVRDKIPWIRGERYDPEQVRDLQNSLIQTGLFNLARVEHAGQVDEQGQLPMTLQVNEVDHKQIRFRLGYETDTGPQGTASWEHNNLWGRGRNLLFALEVSPIRQELLGKYTQEDFTSRDLDLVLQSAIFREDIEAYTSTGGRASAHLEHQIHPYLRLGGGMGYKGSRVEDSQEEQTYHQFSLPAFATWDSRDDPLDPAQGSTHSLHLTPMFAPFKDTFSLFKSSLGSRWYFDLLPESGRVVLALRGKVGIINASSTSEVPADERWYAGGGGSVRGYPYHELGPYEDREPYGGRSLLETSAELRWKWTESIGSAAFVDAGNAYESTVPDPGDKLYWGAGCGLRYYTGIGPLRLDIAFPLTSHQHIDDTYHLYISLGQAF